MRVPVEGLTPATRYHYQVAAYGERMDGAFTTAPAAERRPVPPSSGAAISGAAATAGKWRRVPIFRVMARLPADLFLFVGDTAYADVARNRAYRLPARLSGQDPGRVPSQAPLQSEDPAVQAYLRQTPGYATGTITR